MMSVGVTRTGLVDDLASPMFAGWAANAYSGAEWDIWSLGGSVGKQKSPED